MNMEDPVVMSVAEVAHYISSLELPGVVPVRARRSLVDVKEAGERAATSTSEQDQSASVVNNNLIAFVGELSQQSREDVEHSFLFATLGADKAFEKDPRQEVWYKSFTKTLGMIGWVFPSTTHKLVKSMEQGLTMDALALKLITSIASGLMVPGLTGVIALKTASSAFKALGKHEGPLKLFTKKASSEKGGGFQTGVCLQTSNGGVHMAVGCIRYATAMSATKVLFWEWAAGTAETFTASATISLSESIYTAHREHIRKRIVERGDDYILNLDI